MRTLLVMTVVLMSCGGPNTDPNEQLTLAERDAADRGGASSNTTQQLTVLADSLFDFDPTIDPTKTAAENAVAIEARVRANQNGCGSASTSGTTVTIAFGPPPGCTLQNGAVISGSVSAAVAKSGSTITTTLTLTQVVTNGVPLSGSATFVTSTGSTFSVNANVTSGATTWVITNLTVVGNTGSAKLDGAITVSDDSTSVYTFAGLTWQAGDCYPRAGTITSKKGPVTTVTTFDANTPATGLVKVTVGRKTSTVSLPAYGQCGATDGGP